LLVALPAVSASHRERTHDRIVGAGEDAALAPLNAAEPSLSGSVKLGLSASVSYILALVPPFRSMVGASP